MMRSWKSDARTVHDGLSGRSAFNEAATRDALQRLAADATAIQARINLHSAEGRDIKARFAAFQTDAQAALRDVQQHPALNADFSRLMSDCQSCHDRYKD